MRQPRFRLAPAAVACLLYCAGLAANPVPPDEQSLIDGAENFETFCSACHGRQAFRQFEARYDVQENNDPYGFVELVPDPYAEDYVPQEQADLPEWARPSPEDRESREEEMRALVADELSGVIDTVYGAGNVGEEASELEGPLAGRTDNSVENYGPLPGATDLVDPDAFYFGTSAAELYDSIANGNFAPNHAFLVLLGGEERVWNLVNFIQELWESEVPE